MQIFRLKMEEKYMLVTESVNRQTEFRFFGIGNCHGVMG